MLSVPVYLDIKELQMLLLDVTEFPKPHQHPLSFKIHAVLILVDALPLVQIAMDMLIANVCLDTLVHHLTADQNVPLMLIVQAH
jgi:hypothetical protein